MPHATLLAEIEANQGGLCSGASSEVLSTVGSSMNLCAFSMRKGKLAKHKLRVVRNKPGERKRTALLMVIRVIRKYTSIGSDNHHHCQWLSSSYHHHYHFRHHHENWQNDCDESVLSKSASPSSPESPFSPLQPHTSIIMILLSCSHLSKGSNLKKSPHFFRRTPIEEAAGGGSIVLVMLSRSKHFRQ